MRTEGNPNTVAVAIREECHSSTRKLTKLLNILRMSVNRILMEKSAMRRVLLVSVPHFLTNVQMNDCVAVCQENLGLIKDIFNFFNHVITCDESCVHYFDPKSKQESSQWKLAQFSMKKEGAAAKISGEGARGGFFWTVEEPFISTQSQRK